MALTKQDIRGYADMLRRLRDAMLSDMEEAESLSLGMGGDRTDAQGDESTQASAEEQAIDVIRRDDARLREISAALERIEDDTYGRCGECGQWIDPKRLAAVPEALYCIKCSERVEG